MSFALSPNSSTLLREGIIMSALTSANPDNANPTVYAAGGEKRRKLGDFLDDSDSEGEDGALTWSGESSGSDDAMQDITMPVREEPIDSYEIYGALARPYNIGMMTRFLQASSADLIRSITDPEHVHILLIHAFIP
jgi:hypothetical protein